MVRKGKEFAKPSIEKVNRGEAKFFPPHWINSYNGWMGELRDWCISRQLCGLIEFQYSTVEIVTMSG